MPKVHKYVLIFTSGLMWSGVGIFLNRLAFGWIVKLSSNEAIFALTSGYILAGIIAYFGFSNLANKNVERINQYEGKICFWAFQKWTTYILIIFMMSLGIFMRNTPYIPKYILSPVYIGIGFALFLASFRYYIFLYKNIKK